MGVPAPTTVRPTPWLAGDGRRNQVAVVITVVATAVIAAPSIVLTGAHFTIDTVVLVSFLFWTIYALSSMILTLAIFTTASADELSTWMRDTKSRAWTRAESSTGLFRVRPSLTVQWSVLAMLSVAIISLNPVLTDSALANGLSVAVVVTAWAVTGVAYAVHYARLSILYGGLDFPGEKGAVFSDFLYLSAQVGTTFSSSDVNITTARARRIVTGHTILSFCFGTVIIAVLLAVIFIHD